MMTDLLKKLPRTIAEAIADLVYPPKCPTCHEALCIGERGPVCQVCWQRIAPLSGPRCKRCTSPVDASKDECSNCADIPKSVRRLLILTSYGEAGDIIRLHKFSYFKSIGDKLGTILGNWLKSQLGQYTPDLIIPVPSTPRRRRSRGFVHSELIAHAAGRVLDIKVHCQNLIRTRETGRQMDLGSERRWGNLEMAFRVIDESAVAGKRVLLLDDIISTGATAVWCAKTLLGAGARDVTAAAVARPFTRADASLLDGIRW